MAGSQGFQIVLLGHIAGGVPKQKLDAHGLWRKSVGVSIALTLNIPWLTWGYGMITRGSHQFAR